MVVSFRHRKDHQQRNTIHSVSIQAFRYLCTPCYDRTRSIIQDYCNSNRMYLELNTTAANKTINEYSDFFKQLNILSGEGRSFYANDKTMNAPFGKTYYHSGGDVYQQLQSHASHPQVHETHPHGIHSHEIHQHETNPPEIVYDATKEMFQAISAHVQPRPTTIAQTISAHAPPPAISFPQPNLPVLTKQKWRIFDSADEEEMEDLDTDEEMQTTNTNSKAGKRTMNETIFFLKWMKVNYPKNGENLTEYFTTQDLSGIMSKNGFSQRNSKSYAQFWTQEVITFKHKLIQQLVKDRKSGRGNKKMIKKINQGINSGRKAFFSISTTAAGDLNGAKNGLFSKKPGIKTAAGLNGDGIKTAADKLIDESNKKCNEKNKFKDSLLEIKRTKVQHIGSIGIALQTFAKGTLSEDHYVSLAISYYEGTKEAKKKDYKERREEIEKIEEDAIVQKRLVRLFKAHSVEPIDANELRSRFWRILMDL